jgi:hypothetical protein
MEQHSGVHSRDSVPSSCKHHHGQASALACAGAGPPCICHHRTAQRLHPAVPPAAGKTFGEIRRHYPGSVVCGIINADSEQVRLNVADSQEVGQGARLVALTRRSRLSHSQAALPDYEAAAAKAAERLKGGVSYQSKPKKVIVIGGRARLPA